MDTQLLMIIALDNLLVHRSKVGRLQGKPCINTGLDGSSQTAPYYVRNGTVELLKHLLGLDVSLKVCVCSPAGLIGLVIRSYLGCAVMKDWNTYTALMLLMHKLVPI